MAGSDFVLDNSVVMRWILPTVGNAVMQSEAESVLDAMTEGAKALVPPLWHVEASSVLVREVKRGSLSEAAAVSFLVDLYGLLIDTSGIRTGADRLFLLAREYGLSGYDAAYLDLAMSSGLPLATLDKDMKRAAVKAGVPLYFA